MLAYPEGMLAVSSRHRKEMLDEAQRWRLIRRVRSARRGRNAAIDDPAAHRDDHVTRADAQADGDRRGRIAGWVAAGGRGRVEIAPNPSTRSGARIR